jgi:spermidine synthase
MGAPSEPGDDIPRGGASRGAYGRVVTESGDGYLDEIADDEIAVDLGRAMVLADLDRPSGYLLTVDRIRQSYVDLDDPTYLDFPYMQNFSMVVDALEPGPLAVTHVGGGAMAFARYLAATRPGSSQVVLEPDAALTELVRERLPLPRRSGIRVRPVFGRPGVAELRDAGADLLVVDAFVGGRVPADLGTVEFMADVRRVLKPTGVLLVNLADGPPLTYAKRLVATVGTAFAQQLAVSDSAVLRGRRYGNIVLAASNAELPEASVARTAAASPFPLRLLTGRDVRSFAGRAKALLDAEPMRSPAPPDAAWRIDTE